MAIYLGRRVPSEPDLQTTSLVLVVLASQLHSCDDQLHRQHRHRIGREASPLLPDIGRTHPVKSNGIRLVALGEDSVAGELTDPLAVGVVGLGAMGGGIIRRLHDVGYEVLGLDVETSKRESVERDGIRTARSIEELARSVDVILTSLPNTEAVSDVVLGPQGLIDVAGRRVDTVIEMSTINPNVWQEIAETVLSNGLHCLDAPVTGGPDEARAGELKMYVGGDEDLIARWSELLSVLGDVISVGGTGAGHVVKIVNNLMSIANIAVAAEAMALGVSAGMEPSKLFDALAVGGGRSHGFLKRSDTFISYPVIRILIGRDCNNQRFDTSLQ